MRFRGSHGHSEAPERPLGISSLEMSPERLGQRRGVPPTAADPHHARLFVHYQSEIGRYPRQRIRACRPRSEHAGAGISDGPRAPAGRSVMRKRPLGWPAAKWSARVARFCQLSGGNGSRSPELITYGGVDPSDRRGRWGRRAVNDRPTSLSVPIGGGDPQIEISQGSASDLRPPVFGAEERHEARCFVAGHVLEVADLTVAEP